MVQESHREAKNARGKLFESLALRVLLVSFVFIIAPLIFYAFILFTKDYRERVKEIFDELFLFQRDQITFLEEVEQSNLNFLEAFEHIVQQFQKGQREKIVAHEEMADILKKFAARGKLSAIFYLIKDTNGRFICEESTLKAYVGYDFSKYFDENYLKTVEDHVFVQRDPYFGFALFMFVPVLNDKGDMLGVVGASVGLNKLVTELNILHTVYDTTMSILTKNGIVIASTNTDLLGLQFVMEDSLGPIIFEKEMDGKIPPEDLVFLKSYSDTGPGYEYKRAGKKRFGVMHVLPGTSTYLLLSLPESVVMMEIWKYTIRLGVFLLFILIFGTLATFLVTLRIAKPLKQLKGVMKKVGDGDLGVSYIEDKMGFEINILGMQFNEMVQKLITHIEEAKEERASKEAYRKELQIGHQIQKSILPEENIVFPGIDAGIFFQPAKEVAGDFYDWIVKDSKLMLTIADGVGKGISGCLYAFDLRSILRSYLLEEDNLEQVVIRTNDLFCQDTKETGSFVTAFIAIFDRSSSEIYYANAGHLFPVVKRKDKTIERLEVKGIAFGVEKVNKVEIGKRKLEKGDMVIFFTDGVTDAQNPKEELFSEERFLNVIRSYEGEDSLALVREVAKNISAFTSGREFYDDVTLIVIRVT